MQRKYLIIPPILILVAGIFVLLRPPQPPPARPILDLLAATNSQSNPGAPVPVAPATPAGTAPSPIASADAPPQTVVRERLYNGILLERPWPPQEPGPLRETTARPWLTNRPASLPINVGRQLFVDDFLIESNSLKRTFHAASFYSNNPVLKLDKPWELPPDSGADGGGMAYELSGSSNMVFKLWYAAGNPRSTCVAISSNGLDWEKSLLDVKSNTSIVFPRPCESVSVICDRWDPNTDRRYKLFNLEPDGPSRRMSLYFSADGVHWGAPAALSGPLGALSTAFYNPVRRVWVYSIRADSPAGLARKYFETTNLVSGSEWKENDPVWWMGANERDASRPQSQSFGKPELCNLEMVPYESLMIGLFTISHGRPSGPATPADICVGYSRDGFNWFHPDQEPFIANSGRSGDWNGAQVDSIPGGFLIVGRQLYFYVKGRSGMPGGAETTGLATLRRDGFVSMDAGDQPGLLTTYPLVFSGKQCFVNADVKAGELRMQLMDESNQVLQVTNQVQAVAPDGKSFIDAGKTMVKLDFANCQPIANADFTLMTVNWNGINDLSELRGKSVKFAFQLRNGSLYSFWISPARTGPSGGFIAAGGPHFNAPVDMIGNRSYNKF